MILSDYNVDLVCEILQRKMESLITEGFKGKAFRDELLFEFKKELKKSNGWKENVCQNCLGSGYQEE